jgi:hypothetical protein
MVVLWYKRSRGKKKGSSQWLDKVRMSAEEQNVKNFETAIIEDISSRVGHAIVDYAESKRY